MHSGTAERQPVTDSEVLNLRWNMRLPRPSTWILCWLWAVPLESADAAEQVCPKELSAWSCEVVDGQFRLHGQVSIVALLANPDRFDGVHLAVSGVVSIAPDQPRLYLDELSHRHDLGNNALWLLMKPEVARKLSGKEGSVVTLSGVFKKGPCGHLGASAGCFSVGSVWDRGSTK